MTGSRERSGERLRITVAGPETLVIQPTPEEATAIAGRGSLPGEFVGELPPTPDDRAAGRRRFEVVVDGWRFEALAEPSRWAALRERAARAASAHQPHAGLTLRAQIPGRVVKVWVDAGDQVEQGQRILAVEAMKMENEIRAPHAGRVERMSVAVGQLVERGDELARIA